jgi:probable F420-dependent oxidoreductase
VAVRIGLKVPTRELGTDPGVVAEWVAAVEGVGFNHAVVIEHVVGVDPVARPDYAAAFPRASNRPSYAIGDEFHEPMVTMGYLAARSVTVELVTGVLVLPQRQTALVAKQAAEVDFLSRGRLRLCVGVGWNPVEYEALGADFSTRGRRLEEQIALLRELWTRPVVNFEGEFDRVVGAGIAPMPAQRPIPLWIGGFSDRALARVGRLADGWYCGVEPNPQLARSLELVRSAADAAGRDPGAVGLEGAIELRHGLDIDRRWQTWIDAGATHVTVDPMGCGRHGADHVAFVEEVARVMGVGSADLR